MSLTDIGGGEARIPLKRREERRTETGHSVAMVDDGVRTGRVRVLVDVEALVRMYGPDALRNKGKRARGMAGCVEVVVVPGTVRDRRASQPNASDDA